MARPANTMKQTRTRHSQAYKDEALALAERVGVSRAAEQLGLHASQLYGWRSKQQQSQTSSEREQSLADENARLKRLLAEKSEELASKKGRRVPCQEPQVKYVFMRTHTSSKAHVSAKVEPPFRVIKRQFGYTKVRFRGLAKNTAQLVTLFALSNLWMARRNLLTNAVEVRL